MDNVFRKHSITRFQGRLKAAPLPGHSFAAMYTSFFQSPLGLVEAVASDEGLLSLLFINDTDHVPEKVVPNQVTTDTVKQLEEYFGGSRTQFEIPLCPQGTPFQQQVWQELLKIPFGKTDSYSSIAHKLNNPLSVRAVGTANGRNPISIIIPCHRIIGADGSLTGYAGGLWRKERLLKLENTDKATQTTLW